MTDQGKLELRRQLVAVLAGSKTLREFSAWLYPFCRTRTSVYNDVFSTVKNHNAEYTGGHISKAELLQAYRELLNQPWEDPVTGSSTVTDTYSLEIPNDPPG